MKTVHMPVLPVLCGIESASRVSAESVPQASFNHVIAAFPLEKSLGLPAEVEAGGTRYLLYDPTIKSVPLGYLPSSHAGRNILICTAAGAAWAKVPETALKEGTVKLDLTGYLDQGMALSGQLEIEETGDKWGLSSIRRAGNLEGLMHQVRLYLALPGVVDLMLVSGEVDEAGKATMVFQVYWPMFLTRDLGGLRLPEGLFPEKKPALAQQNQKRIGPVFRDDTGAYHLKLSIESEVALKPRLAEAHTGDSSGQFTWKISGGKQLEASFSMGEERVFFKRDELAQAESWWRPWRNAYNGFLESGLVLMP